MNMHDVATPLTPEDHARAKREMQMRGLPLPDESADIDELIRTAMETDKTDDDATAAVPTLREQLEWHRQMTHDAYEALERRVAGLEQGVRARERQPGKGKTSDDKRDGDSMHGWSDRKLVKAREAVIGALLEGGERFEQMLPAHIQYYGSYALDYPSEDQGIEKPDFIVYDALPEVLRHAFMERFPPVASLIRDEGSTPLSLARFDDWQAFARTFA